MPKTVIMDKGNSPFSVKDYKDIRDARMIWGFASHSPNEHDVPKIIDMKRSTTTDYLSFVFKKGEKERDSIALNDTIIEYTNTIGVNQMYRHFGGVHYSYKYLSDYVQIGIPTKIYRWVLGEAEYATGYSLDRNTLTQSGGYTWITAEVLNENVECCVYSKDLDTLVNLGHLGEKMTNLKSNAIGVGHFEISVMLSDTRERRYLKFTLKKFQLIDRVRKSSLVEVTVRAEPPDDVLAALDGPSED